MGSTDSIKRIDKILFTNARVIEAEKLSEQKQDVVIEDGKLKEIGKISSAGFSGKVVDLHGLALCPGLIDMHVHLREPGGEHKETIETGCDSAMAGGFTGVCPMPNTTPAADNPKIIEFLKNQSKDLLVDVFPIAAVTKDRAGAVLTEMKALVQAGAVAFSDDGDPVATAGILRSAMQNAKKLDVPIIEHCEDKSFSGNWAMNEGVVSMRLGLPGIPGMAEEVMVARDIQVAECTGAKIHIAHISTAKAVALVRQAKKQGVQVTCEVMPHHFILTEEAVSKYDTNAKMSPPLRTQQDVDAMLEGLQDGAIDVLVVNRDGKAHLLHNIVPNRGHWISFRVIEEHGRDALGATVRLTLGNRRITRDVRAAYSYMASNDPKVHPGLGKHDVVTDVSVRWIDGGIESFGDFGANQVVTLQRGDG